MMVVRITAAHQKFCTLVDESGDGGISMDKLLQPRERPPTRRCSRAV